MDGKSAGRSRQPRRWFAVLSLLLVLLLALAAVVGLVSLGNWQLERRVWKQQLIQRVSQRIDQPAAAAPVQAAWSAVSRDSHEYRHVSVSGHFLSNNDTLVLAATELGSGYWVLTPLQRHDGSLVMINRGFIGQNVSPAAVPGDAVTVQGLLRLSEPGGAFLRDNQPAAKRWFSRDIAAIGQALNLPANLPLAPYFIDSAAGQPGSPGKADAGEPVGGLTVVRFHDNHLVYALTWYGLALMVVGAVVLVFRFRRRS